MKKQEGVEGVEDQSSDALTGIVIGAAMAVHSALGPGHLESSYAKALCIEFEEQHLPFRREIPLELSYRGQPVGETRVDFLVKNQLIVELKAVESLLPIHTAQVVSYLRMAHLPFGLLINFNVRQLKSGLKRVSHPLTFRPA